MNRANGERGRGSALEKALVILKAVTEQPQSIGLPDISARVDLPRQTVHRVLQQLEAAGLVARDPVRDRFAVGPQLTELAFSALYSDNHKVPVRNILQRLVDDVRETCNIGVLRGLDYVYVERIECDWPLRMHLQAGSSIPAHCSSAGKVLLAYLPPELRGRLLGSAELRAMTEQTITDPSALEAACAEIRECGYALNMEEHVIGLAGVGVPVLDGAGRAVSALGLHGPIVRVSREHAIEMVPRMQQAAAELAALWELSGPGGAQA